MKLRITIAATWPLKGRLSFPRNMRAWMSKENKWPRWETHGCKWKICTGEWLRRPETCSKSVSGRTTGREKKNPLNHSREVCILTRHLNGLGGSFKPPADTPPTPIAWLPMLDPSTRQLQGFYSPMKKAFNLGHEIMLRHTFQLLCLFHNYKELLNTEINSLVNKVKQLRLYRSKKFSNECKI